MKIAISPDENPGDTGSVAADGTTERSVNVRVAAALQAALGRCGQEAWFDPTISYLGRVAIANADGYQLLVACAHNESTAGKRGTQFVFCPGGQSFGLQAPAAAAVYAQLQHITGWPQRLPDAVEQIYECCAFEADTVYIEYLFMSPDDEPLWSLPDYPEMAAEATCRALAEVYGFAYVEPEITDDDVERVADAVAARFFNPNPGPGQYLTVITQEIANGVDTSGRGLSYRLGQMGAQLDQLTAR